MTLDFWVYPHNNTAPIRLAASIYFTGTYATKTMISTKSPQPQRVCGLENEVPGRRQTKSLVSSSSTPDVSGSRYGLLILIAKCRKQQADCKIEISLCINGAKQIVKSMLHPYLSPVNRRIFPNL